MANERDSITLEDEQVYDKDLLDRLLHENQMLCIDKNSSLNASI